MMTSTCKLRIPVLIGLIVVVFLCTFGTNAYSAFHYVDIAASGSNDGTSWANAWQRFSNISWQRIKPGDTIYISGGLQSKQYSETLTVGTSGTSEKPITITRGKDANHNGTVIIDGNDRRNCVVVERRHYVNISHLRCQNGAGSPGSGTIHVDNSSHIKIENCDFPEIDTHGAVFVQRCSNITISKNTITSPTNTRSQTDGIYSQHNSGNIYEYNHIIIYNQNTAPHCDGIQSSNDTDLTIRGNYIEQDNNKGGNAQGIYATEGGGIFRIYNNVVYCPNSTAGLIAYHYERSGARVEMYNNTATGRSTNLMVISGADSIVKNNILNGTEQGSVLNVLDPLTDISSQIDFNIYHNFGSKLVRYVNDYITWDYWKKLGAEVHGLNKNPQLDSNLRPSSSLSPAIDSGTNLSNLFKIDKEGVSRPQGSAWDMGAFEYTGLNMSMIKPPSNPRIIRVSE